MRKIQLGQPVEHSAPQTATESTPDLEIPSRRTRQRKRLRARKDQSQRWSQWRRQRRKDPLRGERTQAAFSKNGLGVEHTGNLQMQGWFAAIPLDVYRATLALHDWQSGWQIAAPTRKTQGNTGVQSVPGERLVARGTGPDGETTMLCLRFFPEEGGTRLELTQQGVQTERIPATTGMWHRFLLQPLAERYQRSSFL